jgi:nucleoside-diphosphate-sugar epimerase
MSVTDIGPHAGREENIMRIFVTGATGWIGSATVDELLAAGHEVTGLSRTEAGARALEAKGAAALRGDLDDLAPLRAAAAASDGVFHFAFTHDFDDFVNSGLTERAAIEAFGETLAGSDRPLLFASGLVGGADGGLLTEDMPSAFVGADAPRGGAEARAMDFVADGVRAVALRFSPTVHGAGDHGFSKVLTEIARERGVAGYIGDGANRWAAVHRSDAARMNVLALEKAAAGSAVHAVAEEGIPTREIAEAIGAGLGVPVVSIDPADAMAHFGWMGAFFGRDVAASSARTRELLGWAPTGPTLMEDFASGSYFAR